MNPPVLQLPLDLTGQAPTNFVGDEPVRIAATGNRAFVPTRGAFYTRSMIVKNAVTGQELVPDVDYRPVHMVPKPSQKSGLEVCSVVFIPDTYKGALDLTISYQAVGDVYSLAATTIQQMLEGLDLDNRKVLWGDLLDVPEYFPPAAHLHDIGDLFGFEYLVVAVEQLRHAVLLGDQAAFDELRQYVNLQDSVLRNLINQLDANYTEHVNNKANPHGTTKAQVGLSLVENLRLATQLEAEDGNANNFYMTPLRGRQQIQVLVGNSLTAHINNTNNPHSTTKSQVGLGSVVNNPMATTAQAQTGTGDGYMSATLTAAAIIAQAVTPMNAHINNTTNPHNTTKAQVGLSLVDNFKTANAAEAAAGSANNMFLTPLGGRGLIDALVGTSFNGHVNNLSNPHQTTKAQVGLGSVDNFPTATQAQANEGTNNATFMTPARTAQFVSVGVDARLQSHRNDRANPHGVTKVQVDLGNVNNWGVTSQGEAEAGWADYGYMTPLKTRQAITVIAYNPLMWEINNRVVNNSDSRLNSITLGGTGHFLYDTGGGMGIRTGTGGNYKYNTFENNGNLVINNGRIYAGAGFQPSDRRLKKHIKRAQVRALWRGLNWKQWDLKRDDLHQVGLIAQELEEKAPDLVDHFPYTQDNGRRVTRKAINTAGAALEAAFAAGMHADSVEADVIALRTQVAVQDDRIAQLEALVEQLLAKAK